MYEQIKHIIHTIFFVYWFLRENCCRCPNSSNKMFVKKSIGIFAAYPPICEFKKWTWKRTNLIQLYFWEDGRRLPFPLRLLLSIYWKPNKLNIERKRVSFWSAGWLYASFLQHFIFYFFNLFINFIIMRRCHFLYLTCWK